ncbi:GNAT family N-acetyltransferase [Chitinophagaceae bacterium MMS25-I14]
MNLLYRIATPKDLPQLKALGIVAYTQYKSLLPADGWKVLEANISKDETYIDLLNQSMCVVCEADGTIAGMAYLVPAGNPTEIYPADWCCVRFVAVHPAFSGKGIGKRMMKWCIRRANETGEHTIALHTSELMHAARHIYESMGFEIVKEIAPRFGMRYWLYKMEL